jgi:phenylpyruvate tautomerase PptA (4-oxalocrotonate tautomerase family)
MVHESGLILGQHVDPSSERAGLKPMLEQHATACGQKPKTVLLDAGFASLASVKEVNRYLKEAAERALHGILGFEKRPLVSVDFLNDPRSSIVDGPSTMVVDGNQTENEIIEKLTGAMVSIEGENMRGVTCVTIDEAKSGSWGIGGKA